MTGLVLLNGVPVTGLPMADRGFAYGDGVFETIRIVAQRPLLWQYHWERLRLGCARLRIVLSPDCEAQVLKWMDRLLATPGVSASCVVKLVVTRGSGGRGYRPVETPPNIFLSAHPLPADLERIQHQAILKCLNYRLAAHPVLGGIKHLNRLDQVLASMELADEDEGLLLNADDQVIEGTRTNLLLSMQGRLVTPELHEAGVEGVMRRYLLERGREHGMTVTVESVTPQQLADLDGLAIMNSVMGICAVRRLGSRALPQCQSIARLQHSVHKKLGI